MPARGAPSARGLGAGITSSSPSGSVAADPLPASVDHNDLHTGNVFARPDGLRIFDWGDACLTHPFTCLGEALRTATGAGEDTRTGIAAEPLREAYLRCWLPAGEETIPAQLHRTAAVAEAVSFVTLAASWLRLPDGLGPEFGGWFAGFLRDYRAAVATL